MKWLLLNHVVEGQENQFHNKIPWNEMRKGEKMSQEDKDLRRRKTKEAWQKRKGEKRSATPEARVQ